MSIIELYGRARLALCLGLAASVHSFAVAAAPGDTITKTQVRSEEPSVTHQRLRNVVWNLFEQQDYRRDKSPTRPLSSLFLRTKTQATRVPGLCRHDSMRVEFERVDPEDNGPDAPVRPTGLTSTSFFAFLSPPADGYEEIVQDHSAPTKECANLPHDHPFFVAEDDSEATAGYRAWLALSAAVRSGTKFPLECNLTRLDRRSCEEVIASLRSDHLSEVESCDAEARMACHKLYVDDRLITVTTTGHVSPGPPAGQIVSAKLDSLIVMAHEIVD